MSHVIGVWMSHDHLVHSKPDDKDLTRFSGDCETIAAEKQDTVGAA
jgi:hypothetical protein